MRWTVILLVSLFFMGCMGDDPVPIPEAQLVDIEEYVGDRCTGGTEHVFAVDADFDVYALTVITQATDYLNEVLGVDVQICAVINQNEAETWEGYYIRYGEWDGSSIVGQYSWSTGVLDLFLDGHIHSVEHLRKVYLHEMGHHFGVIVHSTNHDDIMCQGWWGVVNYSDWDLDVIGAAIASWGE